MWITDKQFVEHEQKFYLVTDSTSLCWDISLTKISAQRDRNCHKVKHLLMFSELFVCYSSFWPEEKMFWRICGLFYVGRLCKHGQNPNFAMYRIVSYRRISRLCIRRTLSQAEVVKSHLEVKTLVYIKLSHRRVKFHFTAHTWFIVIQFDFQQQEFLAAGGTFWIRSGGVLRGGRAVMGTHFATRVPT